MIAVPAFRHVHGAPFPLRPWRRLGQRSPHSWNRSVGRARAAARACHGEAAGSPALWFGKVGPRPARTVSFLRAAAGSRSPAHLSLQQNRTGLLRTSRPAHIHLEGQNKASNRVSAFFPQRERQSAGDYFWRERKTQAAAFRSSKR